MKNTSKSMIGSNRMLIAMVQSQDVEISENELNKLGISVTRLPSTGAFLGRRNATLLLGFPKGREEEIVKLLQENCRQRVEYIAVPLESAPLPPPTPTPITVGGATIFSIDIEHFEEF
jgi:uncharacterized protein YaaQ